MRKWRLVFGASLLVAGVATLACSNSNPNNGSSADAASDGGASPEGTTGQQTNDAQEASTVEAALGMEAAACTPAPVDVATYDAGSSIWGCIQTMCQMPLAMCATDCVCNAAIYASLQCVPMTGAECVDSSSCITGCFTATLNAAPAVSDSIVQTTLAPCLVQYMVTCGVAPADAGTEGGYEGGTGDGAPASDAAKGG